MERFIAILTEHLAGKWPFWLSPRQIHVCSISEKTSEYCKKVFDILKDEGFEVEYDDSSLSVNKKVRNAQLNQFNYIVVVGQQEE
jgi:threonyl-tRNA synthetase